MATRNKSGASRRVAAKQRQTRSAVMRYGVVLLVLMALAAGLIYSPYSISLPVRQVTIEGDFSHIDKAALVAAVSPYATGNFLTIDVAQLRKAGQALPWVDQIQVKRIWPDRLHLVVIAQIAVARWQDNWLVNKHGELFPALAADIDYRLPVLQGPENSHGLVMARYQTMAAELAEHNLAIKRLIMDKRRAWKIVLTNGIKVVLGRANGEQRFARFIRVYQDQLAQYSREIAAIDLRYSNGLAVIWQDGKQPNFNGTV